MCGERYATAFFLLMVRVGCSAHNSARPDRVFPALGSRTVGIGRPYITGRLKCGVTRSHLTTKSGQSSQWNHLKDRGFDPEIPRDAAWGERYFHMPDPDGHELSFARPLQ